MPKHRVTASEKNRKMGHTGTHPKTAAAAGTLSVPARRSAAAAVVAAPARKRAVKQKKRAVTAAKVRRNQRARK